MVICFFNVYPKGNQLVCLPIEAPPADRFLPSAQSLNSPVRKGAPDQALPVSLVLPVERPVKPFPDLAFLFWIFREFQTPNMHSHPICYFI